MPRTSATARPPEIADVDLIPEPEVRAEPRSRYGNRDYTVLGKPYHVLEDPTGFVETALASFYGTKFHGRRTSSLEVYDMYAFSAAHKTLPLPAYARVTNLANGKSVIVRVNDRGPFHDGRVIDLSYAAAVKLGVHRAGTARVEVRALTGRRSRAGHARRAGAGDPVHRDDHADQPERDGPHGRCLADRQCRSRRAPGRRRPGSRAVAARPWRFDMRRTASR